MPSPPFSVSLPSPPYSASLPPPPFRVSLPSRPLSVSADAGAVQRFADIGAVRDRNVAKVEGAGPREPADAPGVGARDALFGEQHLVLDPRHALPIAR